MLRLEPSYADYDNYSQLSLEQATTAVENKVTLLTENKNVTYKAQFPINISSDDLGKMVAALTAKAGVQGLNLVDASSGQTLGTSPATIATTGAPPGVAAAGATGAALPAVTAPVVVN
jgi:hypothetical protein